MHFPVTFTEADEIDPEDLEAAADYYNRLIAPVIAEKRFGVVLSENLLDLVMQKYACTQLSLTSAIGQVVRSQAS